MLIADKKMNIFLGHGTLVLGSSLGFIFTDVT